MDEFQLYQQEFLDKMEDLRQQVNYCLNNYDYHHAGNEYKILQEQLDTITKDSQELREFINLVRKMKEKTMAAEAMCDQVDEMIAKLSVKKDDSGTTDANECIKEEAAKESVEKNKKNIKFVKTPFSLK